MCGGRVEAHDRPMFRTHTNDMTKALVSEHQATLRHDARRHHTLWGRRTSRPAEVINVTRLAAPEDPAPSVERRAA
jgi:hypothetical protein